MAHSVHQVLTLWLLPDLVSWTMFPLGDLRCFVHHGHLSQRPPLQLGCEGWCLWKAGKHRLGMTWPKHYAKTFEAVG